MQKEKVVHVKQKQIQMDKNLWIGYSVFKNIQRLEREKEYNHKNVYNFKIIKYLKGEQSNIKEKKAHKSEKYTGIGGSSIYVLLSLVE